MTFDSESSENTGSWTICQAHWDKLRIDLKDEMLLVAAVVSMEQVALVTGHTLNPYRGKICPICFGAENGKPLMYDIVLTKTREKRKV